jgi:hypothetical protein
MVQLSANKCSCIAILWVSLVSFAAIILYIASQRVFIVVSIYFVIDSVRKLLDAPSYVFSITETRVCSGWPSTMRFINTRPSSFESFHPLVNFPLAHAVTAILNCHCYVKWHFFSDHKNRVTFLGCCLLHSAQGADMLNCHSIVTLERTKWFVSQIHRHFTTDGQSVGL